MKSLKSKTVQKNYADAQKEWTALLEELPNVPFEPEAERKESMQIFRRNGDSCRRFDPTSVWKYV